MASRQTACAKRQPPVLRPDRHQRGQRSDPAVRMVRRTLAVGLPGNRRSPVDSKHGPVFPPVVPQATQIVPGVGRRQFMQIR